MKTFILFLTCVLSYAASANAGGVDINGGDICENRFSTIRDDLSLWIQGGGSRSLKLPPGILLEDYNEKMLSHISRAQVSCTTDKIFVAGVEKSCKNFFSGSQPTILCNSERFLKTGESGQYVLVHHEYAGLSGFEVNEGTESQYVISNQLTNFLEDQIVKKLVVKPAPRPNCNGAADADGIRALFSPGSAQSRNLGPFTITQRTRDCSAISGCSPWRMAHLNVVYTWVEDCPKCQSKRELTNLHGAPNASFYVKGPSANIYFAFELLDAKGRRGLFTCSVGRSEVDCRQTDSENGRYKWRDDRTYPTDEIYFRGQVGNRCAQLVSSWVKGDKSLSHEYEIELNGAW